MGNSPSQDGGGGRPSLSERRIRDTSRVTLSASSLPTMTKGTTSTMATSAVISPAARFLRPCNAVSMRR